MPAPEIVIPCLPGNEGAAMPHTASSILPLKITDRHGFTPHKIGVSGAPTALESRGRISFVESNPSVPGNGPTSR